MTEQTEKIAVIPDLHGRADLLQAAHRRYGDIGYVILGDIIDGEPQVKQAIDIAKDIGAVLLKGNHEWTMLAALNERDEEVRRTWQNQMWLAGMYEKGTLKSYGVKRYPERDDTAKATKEVLAEVGHMNYLANAPLYFEGPDFIVVHAGLTKWSWLGTENILYSQKKELEKTQELTKENNFTAVPPQVFDDPEHNLALSSSPEAFVATGKTVITGHAHLTLPAEERLTAGGKRVRLASHLNNGEVLFVWESWTGNVVAIEQNS